LKEVWETDRTALAATLMTEGFQLLDLAWRPAPRLAGGYACWFVFAWDEELSLKAVLFRRGGLRVEPVQYGKAYADLRQRMNLSRQEQVLQAAG
jgi:hypothetical protein